MGSFSQIHKGKQEKCMVADTHKLLTKNKLRSCRAP